MTLGTLIVRNLRRHPLRVTLTALGIATAILAFNFIVTTVRSWHAGVEASAQNRLITRHAASLSIHLPLAHRDQLEAIPGITGVSYANWFGGVYRDAKGFFPQYAVEPASYLDLHPEFLLSPEQREAFLRDRRGCVIGRTLASQYGWRLGDVIPLRSGIYPGDWEFVVRGIYSGAEPATDESLLLLHWDYLNERRRVSDPDRAGSVGWFVVRVADAAQAPAVAQAIDTGFANSMAETRTETEQAYRMGFVAMSGALILALRTMAVLLNGITLVVLATSLVMAVRERTREYAMLKTLGFRPSHLAGMILGESLAIAGLGAGLGVALTLLLYRPFGTLLANQRGMLFRLFHLHPNTLLLAGGVALVAGLAAAAVPAFRVVRLRIMEGLRHVG